MIGVHGACKKYIFIVLAVLLFSGNGVGAWADRPETAHIAVAEVQESYSLVGQWQFQPGDELDWAEPDYDDSSWADRRITTHWPIGGYPESNQFAWYRLTLKFDVDAPERRRYLSHLGVSIGKVMSAYELYAGGELLGGVGKLPPQSETDYDRTRVFPVPISAIAQDGTLVLALRAWGGGDLVVSKWGGGPYEGDFRIGEHGELLRHGFLKGIPGLMASVLFLGFGFYHIYLYQRNRQLKTYLWYGLLALDIGIYGLIVNQWRYSLGWSFVAYQKVEYATLYLISAFAIQMMWSLLQLPIKRWLRAYQLSFVAFAIVVATVPGLDIHYHTLRPLQLWSLPLLVGIPWIFIREAYAGNPEARTGLIGILVFTAACINDLFIDYAGWEGTRLIIPGFAAIMLFMAISVANRFTTVFNNLEGEVTQRTADLSIANQQLAQAARLDPLTGLLNRRGFTEAAEAELRRRLRTGQDLSIVLADLDNFKEFNDQHGHACGDYVLQETAQLLSDGGRAMDNVSRWGGEEFLMVLPETSSDGAVLLAEKLRSGMEARRFEYQGQRLGVTMTFGIATFRKDDTLDKCIARADTALYKGKQQGRNRVVVEALESE